MVGHATPLDPRTADCAAETVREALDVGGPRWWRRLIGATGDVLATAIDASVDGLGDGVVTVASAAMPGARDVVLVPGNHASMLARLLPFGDEVPPAIPVVLERLEEEPRDADETRSGSTAAPAATRRSRAETPVDG